MPNEFPISAFPSSDDAVAAIALPKVLDYFKEFYCSKVKTDILRYGVEEALRLEAGHRKDAYGRLVAACGPCGGGCYQ